MRFYFRNADRGGNGVLTCDEAPAQLASNQRTHLLSSPLLTRILTLRSSLNRFLTPVQVIADKECDTYGIIRSMSHPLNEDGLTPGPGLMVDVGLGYFVELKGPSEVIGVCKGRLQVIQGKRVEVESEIERVGSDMETVLRSLEALGGGFVKDGK